MTIGKLLIVMVTVGVITKSMEVNGASFTSQMLVAIGVGGFLGFIDALSEDKTKDGK